MFTRIIKRKLKVIITYPDPREMWSLEYEVDELQTKFAESIGTMDLDNLDVDFIEDMMLKAKPLQSVLNLIRNKQIVSRQTQTSSSFQTELPSSILTMAVAIFHLLSFPPPYPLSPRPSWRTSRRFTETW